MEPIKEWDNVVWWELCGAAARAGDYDGEMWGEEVLDVKVGEDWAGCW